MSFEHLVTSITSHLTSQIPKESTVILYNSSFSSLFDLYTRFKQAELEGNLPEKNFIVALVGDIISVVMEYLGGSDYNTIEGVHPLLLQSLNQVGIEVYVASFACMLMAATSIGVIMTKSIKQKVILSQSSSMPSSSWSVGSSSSVSSDTSLALTELSGISGTSSATDRPNIVAYHLPRGFNNDEWQSPEWEHLPPSPDNGDNSHEFDGYFNRNVEWDGPLIVNDDNEEMRNNSVKSGKGLVRKATDLCNRVASNMHSPLILNQEAKRNYELEIGRSHVLKGKDLEKKGDLEGSLSEFQMGAKILTKHLGEDDIETAGTYHIIGVLLARKGELNESLIELYKGLRVFERELGEHHETGLIYNDIGNILVLLDSLEQALIELKRSMEIFKKVLRWNHVDIADTHNSIGSVLQKLGNIDGAMVEHREALHIFLKVFGKYHPKAAITRNRLGLALFCNGDSAHAMKAFSKVLEIKVKLLGEEHRLTASSYTSMGLVLESLGYPTSALKVYKKAYHVQKIHFGHQHPDTINTKELINNISEEKSGNKLQVMGKELMIRSSSSL